jgi:hypothetical protein
MKKFIAALVAALLIGVSVGSAQSTRRAIGNLMGKTDDVGALYVYAVAATAPDSTRRAISNLLGKTDDAGALYVVLASGSTVASPTFTGQAKFADGTAGAPSITFASDPDTGYYKIGDAIIGVTVGGNPRFKFDGTNGVLGLASSMSLVWTDTTNAATGTVDTVLKRAAANILTMVNGNNAQYLRFDSGAQGTGDVGVDSGGNLEMMTNSNRAIQFGTNTAMRWEILGAGHLSTVADNTYDIGASGSSRPRNVYIANTLTVGSTITGGASIVAGTSGAFSWSGPFSWSGLGSITQPNDGVTRLYNNASTRSLQFHNDGIPTCSSNCGTSPSVTGVDSSFTVTMGAAGTPASGFVITFSGTNWASAPQCTGTMGLAGMAVGKMPIVIATTASQMTVTTNGTAPSNSDVYHFRCSLGGT